MAHVEVTVDVDHRRTDGLEECRVLQLKLDGLAAGPAWRRVNALVGVFLDAEEEDQRVADQEVQAAEGPWCNDNSLVVGEQRFLCNLPPAHRGPHENFQSGRSWPQRTPQHPEQKRLYHQAMINRIWCNESPVEGEPRGNCCNLWRHHAGPHEHDRERDNQYQEDCA